MKRFKTYIPVLEEEYERLKEQRIKDYNPKIRTQVNLESEVEEILANSTLRDDEKLRVLQLALNRIQGLLPKEQPSARPVTIAVKRGGDTQAGNSIQAQDQMLQFVPVAPTTGIQNLADVKPSTTSEGGENFEDATATDDVPTSTEEAFENVKSLLSKFVPSERLQTADAFIDHLRNVSGVSVGPNYQLFHNHKPIEGAYMLDVLDKLYRKNRLNAEETIALGPFVDFLKNTNINPRLVCKQDLQSLLKPHYQDPNAPSVSNKRSVIPNLPSFSLFPKGDPTTSKGMRKRKRSVNSETKTLHVLRVY